jgi:MraZ protein
MFLGEYQHTIDAKGRIAIPAKFRGELVRGIVLVRGIEACLFGYGLETWEEKARALDALDLDDAKRRQIERRFFGTAQDCELDAQGRIVVPPSFRRYADLTGECVVIGARQRFEIWSRARWETYLDDTADLDLAGLKLPF